MNIEQQTIRLLHHPLGAESLTHLRDVRTKPPEFRRHLHHLTRLLAFEATFSLTNQGTTVMTPLALPARGAEMTDRVVAVPILRAALGMLNGFLEIVPSADVGFIGLRRDEATLLPSEYYRNLPPCTDATVFILDPMLATGGTAMKAIADINLLSPRSITLITIIAAPQGVAAINNAWPDVTIFSAALDDGLNERGYIVPGLGDAGDRLWGTL